MIIVFLLWEVLVMGNWVDRKFLPPPHDVMAALWEISVQGELLVNLWATLFCALLGLALATVVGVVLGASMATRWWINGFFGPLVAATYSLPKSALIPLFILWFGIGDVTNTLVVFLGCLLPVLVSTYHGIASVPKAMIWSAQGMETSSGKILRRILLPAAMAPILNGIRIALGYCFVLVLSAEMIATKNGMGKLIFLYGEGGLYSYMLGGIMAVVLVAFVCDRAFIRMTTRLLHWDDTYASGAAK
ncbi:ABC transporter permease [Pollutimonas thiosulfatoxidans]|uniref:ABC transporter permease n=1 Tax=Pollutimonas thiosulfatoxidans TaxID=2028345 RepID=UPI001A7EFCD9|nr:ABC transporter permease [Pollutimonas thiosulfatoxidans]